MIDLRSDTVTLPSRKMLASIQIESLGDAGRENAYGRGEDAETNRLEDMAAELTGKDAAAFYPTGTMANTAAILTWCSPGAYILVDEMQHILCSEKVAFSDQYYHMHPVICPLSPQGGMDALSAFNLLKENPVSLVCLENTHNFSGGKIISIQTLERFRTMTCDMSIPIHMDGARIFHAAEATGKRVAELCAYSDSVMFCISKGLGAPIGSLLCGDAAFIGEARKVRRLLGGTMRQSGIAAACGRYALENNVARLREDRENAQFVGHALRELKCIRADKEPQTNIVLLDIAATHLSVSEFCGRLAAFDVICSAVNTHTVRLVFHLGINRADADAAVNAIGELDRSLQNA